MLRKRSSVTIELRLRAQVEARRDAQRKLKMILVRFLVGLAAVVAVFFLVATDVLARESRIEEVHGNQLEKLLASKDFVAVFWYARSCRQCEEALEELEDIDDDARRFSVDFVKVNDKRLAKSYGISRFPALTFFRDGELTLFDGDMTDEDEVLEFLTSESFLVIPDKIENVNAESLATIVAQEALVTVLFYDGSKESAGVIAELENIDDEADVFKIRFVKINDDHLAEEYSLAKLPALVYFRGGIPIVYQGDLRDEEEVLEWLIQHQTSADEEDVVESVGGRELDIMVRSVDHLLVLFHDNKKKSQLALESLEHMDDDCDKIGVSFVEVDEVKVAKHYGVDRFPTLVYFENEIPAVYEGDAGDVDRVLAWLVSRVEGADIEEVNDNMLDKMVVKEEKIAVLFYKQDDKESKRIVGILEEIDDDLDEKKVLLVKTGEKSAADDYGIDKLPSLVVFKKGIPNLYQGMLDDPDQVLAWIVAEVSGDNSVEVVTDAMLERLIATQRHVAVFFYDKRQEDSLEALRILEEIDDDVQIKHRCLLVKIDDRDESDDFGITQLPTLVLFEKRVPNVFTGDLLDVQEILGWIDEHVLSDTIEEVNAKMLERLLEEKRTVIAYVYHEDFEKQDERILRELEEGVDDELEALGVHLVKLSDEAFAERHGVEVTPALVALRPGGARPMLFEGEVGSAREVVEWVKEVVLKE